MARTRPTQAGMTLIELMIAVAIGAIVLAALNSVVSLGLQAQASGRQGNELVFQARFALERMITTARSVPPKLLATPTAGTTGDWFSPVMYSRNGCQLIETTSTATGNSTVATVNSTSGVATGVASGTSVITAAYLGKTATATLTVTVTTPTLVSIAVTPPTASVPIRATQQFMVCATYSDGSTRDVTASSSWTSGTASVATVLLTTGVATGVASGTSVITATFGGKTATATLTVTVPTATLVSVAVTPAPASVSIGGKIQFTATATYSDQSTLDVTASSTWTSNANSVATVLPTTGLATGVASGTSSIKATLGSNTATATLTVNATTATLVSIAVTPTIASVPISGTQQFMATATYNDGSTRDVTTSSSWTSGDASTGPKVVASNVSAFSAQLPSPYLAQCPSSPGPVDRPVGTLSLTLATSAAPQSVTLCTSVRLGGGAL